MLKSDKYKQNAIIYLIETFATIRDEFKFL